MRWMSLLATVLVLLPSTSRATINALAVSGENADGIADAKFDSFSQVSLNSNGHAAFLATLQAAVGGVTISNDVVLYSTGGSGLSLRAREGSGGVPAVANANFVGFAEVAIADTGDVLARASLETGPGSVNNSSDEGLWRFSNGGDELLARTGIGDAPGVSGGKFKSFSNFIRTTENGDTALSGNMLSGGTIGLTNDAGIWFYQGSVGTLIAREGSSFVPGVPNATFSTFFSPSINNNTQGTARGTLNYDATLGINSTNNVGVWRYTGINGELLARKGVGTVPGATSSFSSFGNPVINDSGQVAFRADLSSGSDGIWKYTSIAGELIAIANTGAVPDVPGASFSTFDNPRIADTGTIMVRADLNTGSGGVSSGNRTGIWRFTSSGKELLVRTGSGGVPGVAGANFSAFDEYTVNAGGSAVIAATLAIEPGGASVNDNSGIWLVPQAGAPELIARTGEQLAGRTVAGLSLLSNDFYGRPVRGFNNQNQVLFQASFTNGDEGLFLFTPGGGAGADFNMDTFVDATDLGMWQAAYAATTGGDADGDGDTDGADFLAWQRQYTGPGALATNLIVPEPSPIFLSLTLFGILLPRRFVG